MNWTIHHGDALTILKTLPNRSVHCCVTSPPYWGLRDYGVSGQMGLEPTLEEYVAKMVEVFREVRRVLRDDGTLWLNLGDSYVGTGGNRGNSPNNGPNSCVGSTAAANMPMQGRFQVSKSKRIERGSGRWGGGKMSASGILKPKDLVGIPWRVAFALQADGWYLRSDIVWSKPNPMPESVADRPTKAHEYIFLLSKSQKYYYDYEAIKEPTVYIGKNNGVGFGHGTDKELRERNRVRGSEGILTKPNSGRRKSGNKERKTAVADRVNNHIGSSIPWEDNTRNKRTVWTVATQPFSEAHFATFPPKLIEPCILAGCPESGTVLDPFSGSGTTGMVALRHNRRYVGIELNSEYVEMSKRRIMDDAPLFNKGVIL